MRKRTGGKFAAMMTVVLLVLMPMANLSALNPTMPDNDPGSTLNEIAAGSVMDRNRGTVVTNNGEIDKNHALVTNNKGTVRWNGNAATVTNNNGLVSENNGTVTINNATVATNYKTVTDNKRLVSLNAANGGKVVTNNNTVTTNNDTVTTNNDTVANNSATGTVITNNGTITSNSGAVTTNKGRVSTNKWGATVTTNERGGEVNNNGGTVTTNKSGGIVNNEGDGTVTTNEFGGIVNNYSGGTVTTNNGTLNEYHYVKVTGGENAELINFKIYKFYRYILENNTATIKPKSGWRFKSAPTVTNGTVSKEANGDYTLSNVTASTELTLDMERVPLPSPIPQPAASLLSPSEPVNMSADVPKADVLGFGREFSVSGEITNAPGVPESVKLNVNALSPEFASNKAANAAYSDALLHGQPVAFNALGLTDAANGGVYELPEGALVELKFELGKAYADKAVTISQYDAAGELIKRFNVTCGGDGSAVITANGLGLFVITREWLG